jgi:hypothetical protein
MVGCMLVMAGSSFTVGLNLVFDYNTVNSNVLGVVIALVNTAYLGLILWSLGSVDIWRIHFCDTETPALNEEQGHRDKYKYMHCARVSLVCRR